MRKNKYSFTIEPKDHPKKGDERHGLWFHNKEDVIVAHLYAASRCPSVTFYDPEKKRIVGVELYWGETAEVMVSVREATLDGGLAQEFIDSPAKISLSRKDGKNIVLFEPKEG